MQLALHRCPFSKLLLSHSPSFKIRVDNTSHNDQPPISTRCRQDEHLLRHSHLWSLWLCVEPWIQNLGTRSDWCQDSSLHCRYPACKHPPKYYMTRSLLYNWRCLEGARSASFTGKGARHRRGVSRIELEWSFQRDQVFHCRFFLRYRK